MPTIFSAMQSGHVRAKGLKRLRQEAKLDYEHRRFQETARRLEQETLAAHRHAIRKAVQKGNDTIAYIQETFDECIAQSHPLSNTIRIDSLLLRSFERPEGEGPGNFGGSLRKWGLPKAIASLNGWELKEEMEWTPGGMKHYFTLILNRETVAPAASSACPEGWDHV